MGKRLVSPPTDLVVSLSEAKEHLGFQTSDTSMDTRLTRLINAATLKCETDMQCRKLAPQTWEFTFDAFPDNELRIPFAPLIDVLAVEYYDADGNIQTFADTDYEVDDLSEPAWIVPGSSVGWPTTFSGINSSIVRVRVGYDPVSTVPEDIRQAILLMVGHWNENREAINVGNIVNDVPHGVSDLLQRHRIYL